MIASRPIRSPTIKAGVQIQKARHSRFQECDPSPLNRLIPSLRDAAYGEISSSRFASQYSLRIRVARHEPGSKDGVFVYCDPVRTTLVAQHFSKGFIALSGIAHIHGVGDFISSAPYAQGAYMVRKVLEKSLDAAAFLHRCFHGTPKERVTESDFFLFLPPLPRNTIVAPTIFPSETAECLFQTTMRREDDLLRAHARLRGFLRYEPESLYETQIRFCTTECPQNGNPKIFVNHVARSAVGNAALSRGLLRFPLVDPGPVNKRDVFLSIPKTAPLTWTTNEIWRLLHDRPMATAFKDWQAERLSLGFEDAWLTFYLYESRSPSTT